MLKKFFLNKKFYVVIVVGENRDVQMLIEDVKCIVYELDQGQQLLFIGVELVDNELVIFYMNSKKLEVEFWDYFLVLRQVVFLVWCIQDFLIEFVQVCSFDEDILCFKFYFLQEYVVKEELFNVLYCEFIN